MEDFSNLFSDLYDEAVDQLESDKALNSSSFQQLAETQHKYTQKELVALGGMKKVFRVYDNFAKRDLAMATLYDDAESDTYDLFIHEAWLTSQLDHPNIITIHDVGINDAGKPYFTMDLKVGDDFKKVITTQNGLPLEELLELFLKVCDAVSYAHSKHILHLDLKPNNIQIGQYGEVLVCDWGLGRLLVQDETVDLEQELVNSELLAAELHRKRVVKGTPGFMAPEQVSGADLTKQTDIYELGSILYSILTREIPIEGSLETVLKNTVEGNVISPNERVDDFVPESLNAVVMKAMALNPQDRYKSVVNLRQEVHKYLMGYSTLAENAGFIKEFKLFYRRNRTSSNIFFSLFIVVMVIIGGFLIGLERSRQSERDAKQAAQNSREKLEYTLQLFAEEKEAYSQVLDDYTKDVSAGLFLLNSASFFKNPVKVIEKQLVKIDRVLEHDPEKGKYLSYKAYQLFIAQKYEESYNIAKNNRSTHLEPILKVIEALKINRKKTVSVDELLRIMQVLTEGKSGMSLPVKMFYYDNSIRKDKRGYEKIVRFLLRYHNAKWKKPQFSYDAVSKTMTISGKGFKKASYIDKGLSVSLIRFLPIKTLILSNSEFYDISQLVKVRIETLDISNTFIANLNALKNNKTLKTLIVVKGQFTKKVLETVPPRINVVEKPKATR